MRAPRWIMWSWPGLQSLWQYGHVAGLVQAAAFALLLNLCLVTTCIWPGLLEPSGKQALWLGLVAYWVFSVWSACRNHGNMTRSGDPGALFIKAQDEYLQGDWYGAERILRKILKWQPHDVEARLLLATLLRHTLRVEEAKVELRRLQKIVHAAHWLPELAREWQALEKVTQRVREDAPDRTMDGTIGTTQGPAAKAA